MIKLIAAARFLVRGAKRRIGALRRPPPRLYQPDLTDEYLLTNLRLPSGGRLSDSGSAHLPGRDTAIADVVEYFVNRKTPRFFVDLDGIAAVAATIERDRAPWAEALRGRVDDDVERGLSVLSKRGRPLRDFDWSDIGVGAVGDKLFTVQPHRFGFMPRLALAAHHRVATLPVIVGLLDGWIAATRVDPRMSYLTPLVVLYRLVALSWTFALVASVRCEDQKLGERILFTILKIVAADIRYLHGTIGHAFPNNHLLADGFAGWFCGTLYPELEYAAQCKAIGEPIFLRELQRQFHEDGAGFEHAMHYHELGCEMTVAYVLLEQRNGRQVRPEVTNRLKAMLALQAAVSGPEANPLTMGNSIEDPLFPLDPGHGWAPGAMRELYRSLFDGGVEPSTSDDSTIARAWWLLGAAHPAPAAPAAGTLPDAFPCGGLYVCEDARRHARLVFRSGPREGLPISAGHAHADVLSVHLSVDRVPLVVDSGTYTYRLGSRGEGEPDWRSYFAGPWSHNGPAPDVDPYGALRSDFRGTDVPCRVTERRDARFPGLTWREFEVTGVNSLTGWRRGVVHVDGHYFLVYDLPAAQHARGHVSVGLQFSVGARVAWRGDRTLVIRAHGASCSVSLSAALTEPSVVCGSLDPLGGWVSSGYGALEPAPQLRARVRMDESAGAFVLQPGLEGCTACHIDETVVQDGWLGLRIVQGDVVDHVLLRTSAAGDALRAWDMSFSGSIAWVRRDGKNVLEVRRSDDGELIHEGQTVSTAQPLVRPG